jgi:hypothetical protein
LGSEEDSVMGSRGQHYDHILITLTRLRFAEKFEVNFGADL